MMTVPGLLPFDPSGTLPSNKIINESHTLLPPLVGDFFLIMPRKAPYFRVSLKIKEVATNRYWELGKDYALTHLHHGATYGIGTGVYGTITILNRSFSGTIIIEYQSLGGPWTLDDNQLVAFLENVAIEPRRSTWEMVQDLPEQFPAIPHNFDIGYIGDINQVIDGLIGIKEAILSKSVDVSLLSEFITAETIGLGNLMNYRVATLAEALELVGNRYLTPANTQPLIAAEVKKLTDENLGGVITAINTVTAEVLAL